MAKCNDVWKVLPHRPIQKLAASLWRVEGDLEGMPLKRVMSVARRSDGRLVLHNAIALDDDAMQEIDAWGEVGFILVPNGFHRLDAKVFHERYPTAVVLCPSGSRKKVEEVVPVSGSYEDFPTDSVVSLETLQGTGAQEGAMIVRDGDESSVVLNDSLFNMPHLSGFQGFVFKHITASTGGPKVSRVAKFFIVKDKGAFKAHLTKLAELPGLRRVVVSHHETIDKEPGRVLAEVAAGL